MIRYGKLLLVAFFSIIIHQAFATVVSGRVTDDKGAALPFSGVYLQGTTNGTTANAEGFYQLTLAPGRYTIAFRCIGYELKTIVVTVNTLSLTLNASLKANSIELKTVTISARSEDPAYPIIRKAIKKRKFYLEQVKSYSCSVYMKGVQKIKKYPKKFFGQTITPDMIGVADTLSGIAYLSESVSRYSFERPDKVKEEMISSKVSGSNKAFSFNQSADRIMNFYEPLVLRDFLSQRGFLSPIAPTAMLSYKYHLAGTFIDGGHFINKIEVKPLHSADPSLTGVIYIADSTWRLNGLDLMVTKQNGLQYVDTCHIMQTFAEAAPGIWIAVTTKLSFNLNIFGFIGDGYFVQSNTDYQVNPIFDKSYFTNEELKITAAANKKDTAYWNSFRPVPLTKEEQKDYVVKDGMQTRKESRPYLDSMDRKTNKFKWSNTLLGYTHSNRFEKSFLSVAAPINTIDFNAVEGLNIGTGLTYTKNIEAETNGEDETDRISVFTKGRYGFSNHKPSVDGGLTYAYNRKRFARLIIKGGSTDEQFNKNNPVIPFANTDYTLFAHENFLKLYRKNYISAEHRLEFLNGLIVNAGLEYAYRDTLSNTSNYSFVQRDKQYELNNQPLVGTGFTANRALTLSASAIIRFQQKYSTRPGRKIILGSKYPTLTLQYRKGIKGLTSVVDYDLGAVSVSDQLQLGLLGSTEYKVTTGRFLRTGNAYFMDYTHFMGNQTLYSSFNLERFNDLPYYAYSTTGPFLEAHVEHSFGGFILNKFPLIRRLRMTESAAFHFLKTDRVQYIEVSAGVQRGLIPIKVEVFKTFINGLGGTVGARLALPFL